MCDDFILLFCFWLRVRRGLRIYSMRQPIYFLLFIFLLMTVATALSGFFAATAAAVAATAGTALTLSAGSACRTADTFHASSFCSYDVNDCSPENRCKHKNQNYIFHRPAPFRVTHFSLPHVPLQGSYSYLESNRSGLPQIPQLQSYPVQIPCRNFRW